MAWRGLLGMRLLGNTTRCMMRNARNPELLSEVSVARCSPPSRHIAVSPSLFVKEIIVEATDKETTIEGIYKESDRTDVLVKTEHTECGACSLCALQLNLKHTDVLVLSQFMRSDGCMLPKRITGLCGPQQKRVTLLVAMAQKAGLMPNLAPHWSKKNPKKRFGSRKYNRYFDENTLKIRF
ncbi:28S ribosomal protein S18a, mitochondrial-like [Penaeus japonicus]|uniref:28S ribosomal protein S18a, mitochondrial-like n=1 Tax=Penaeus japonicus TaxID=27405 RepID=UPI001C716DDD|nr:28S ribosomal protein S18a, mitochondrial-like [Penaeus japonicus]